MLRETRPAAEGALLGALLTLRPPGLGGAFAVLNTSPPHTSEENGLGHFQRLDQPPG